MAGSLTLRRGDRLVLASHNAGKLSEFQELFAPFGLDIVSAGEMGVPEPEETGTTFAENARLKAHASAKGTGLIALSDDSGLCVDALGGKPGIHTARWAGPERDFAYGMRRVEDALAAANATSPGQRRGQFVAMLCLAHPDGRDVLFEGIAPGTLVWPPRGTLGFGFDPVFMPEGFDITYGEMSSEQKHSWAPGRPGLSHRARAFAKLVESVIER
ncbi:non-canonical purine NTP pyrophosphatase [Arsenicitalea aurantiaca]|uniref:dITP/XTP pyrophosphatase n=1 Tax=Arsenicitalea aurantiaca TaxID=1783274 RepID=A0A433X7X2_9HYPH|nr:non-canonical purine NTP pyrophosphatase [Arsenicitalea aurantiaca]RUT30181.1 non-canonical purine NTP pyrophosphatase [Arsenicitalea aurantiaca]